MSARRKEIVTFILALQFLTRLPFLSRIPYSDAAMAATPRYYPLVGMIIGGMTAGAFVGLAHLLPVTLAVLVSTVFSLLLTGAFHEDGLADTFDGLGGGQSKDQALEIMKDSRLGTYGAAALGLALSVKIVALAALNPFVIVTALICGHGLSRLSAVLIIKTSTYVREHGTGKPTSAGISNSGMIIALITGALCFAILILELSPEAGLYATLGLMAGHLAMRIFTERKLGGYTGDTLGAVQQVSEIGFYLGLVAWL